MDVLLKIFNSDGDVSYGDGLKTYDVDLANMFCKPDEVLMSPYNAHVLPFNRLFGWINLIKPDHDKSLEIIKAMNSKQLLPVIEIYIAFYSCQRLVYQRIRFVNVILLQWIDNSVHFLREGKELITIAYTRIETAITKQAEMPKLYELPVLATFNFQTKIKEKIFATQS